MERIALLSHKLENLLEILRQGKTRRAGWEVNQDIIDTLIEARDRIAMLMADVEKDHEEKTEIDDLIDRIDKICANPYGETGDEANFTGDQCGLALAYVSKTVFVPNLSTKKQRPHARLFSQNLREKFSSDSESTSTTKSLSPNIR
jgi:chemotaxis protein histidine kinase CheA